MSRFLPYRGVVNLGLTAVHFLIFLGNLQEPAAGFTYVWLQRVNREEREVLDLDKRPRAQRLSVDEWMQLSRDANRWLWTALDAIHGELTEASEEERKAFREAAKLSWKDLRADPKPARRFRDQRAARAQRLRGRFSLR